MLLVEIILTIIAWNRGWRGYALIPIGVCVAIGLIVGAGIASSGGSTDDLEGLIVLDIVASIILLYMSIKKREVKEVTSDVED